MASSFASDAYVCELSFVVGDGVREALFPLFLLV
jgi:hypothetical protein